MNPVSATASSPRMKFRRDCRFPATTFVKRSSPARAISSARSRCSCASSSCPLIQHESPEHDLGARLAPRVAEVVQGRRRRAQLVGRGIRVQSGELHARRGLGGRRHRGGLFVAALAEQAHAVIETCDHLIGGVLPHLAPAHEEGGDAPACAR